MQKKQMREKMNYLKTKNEQVHPKEASTFVENIVSNNFLSIIHEPSYPDTRKDVCLVKATIMKMQESFDIIYLLWKNNGELQHTKLWGTTIYDPPLERHLMIGYLIEEKKNLLAKIYPSSDPCKGYASCNGTIYSINKEKLGLN